MASPSGSPASGLNFVCNSPDQPQPWFGGVQNTNPLTGLLNPFLVFGPANLCRGYKPNVYVGIPPCPLGQAAFPNGTVSTITADLESQINNNGVWSTNQFFGGNTLNMFVQDPTQQLTMWKSAPITFTFNNLDTFNGNQLITPGFTYQEFTGQSNGNWGNFFIEYGLKQINCTIFAVMCGLTIRNQPINFYLFFDQFVWYNSTTANFTWWHPNSPDQFGNFAAASFLFCPPGAIYPQNIYNIAQTCDRIKLENIIVLP